MKLLKKLLSTLAIAAVVLVTNCSSDEGITTNQSGVNLAEAGLKETFLPILQILWLLIL